VAIDRIGSAAYADIAEEGADVIEGDSADG
jgi:hypothetical protein